MKNIQLEINIRHMQLEELNADERELVEAAIKATDNSYAKYSHFRVGAALRLGNGRMVIGANQENAVFPLGSGELPRPTRHCNCCSSAQRIWIGEVSGIALRFMPAGHPRNRGALQSANQGSALWH